jgi:hypothetical protein
LAHRKSAVGQLTFQYFFQNENNQNVYLALLLPIFAGLHGTLPMLAMLMRIGPSISIPLSASRTPSQTAETLMLRRDGNNALF